MSGYPITLVGLNRARCVVVGGGAVAARKVAALRAAGARPVVISPALVEELEHMAARGEIEAVRRAWQPGDLAGVRLAIVATDDPATNEAAWREGEEAGCLVNVVDDPAHCHFHVPATVRRGELSIAVSTGGCSPALARRIRERLEIEFDAAYEPYVALLGELRATVQAGMGEAGARQAVREAVLDSDVLELLRSGETEAARALAVKLVADER